ncbi:hypothetical protein [Enterococcus rivorum]|uniref:hypothetical protein n=1 Tax=Enterococcus rivorum TaxID=762845 RepID=UPI00363C75F0
MKIFIEKKKTILVSVLCVLLLITGGFVYSLYQEIKESVEKTYKEVDSKKFELYHQMLVRKNRLIY